MTESKTVKGVIVPRHDTAKNWAKAVNFTPKKGELIVYDTDDTMYETTETLNGQEFEVVSSGIVRFKFGDGKTNVNLLPFVTTEGGGTGGGVSIEQVESRINEMSESLIYLATTKQLGGNIELPDTFPTQSKSAVLKVVSANRLFYSFDTYQMAGINFNTNGKKYLTISGTPVANLGGLTQQISRTMVHTAPGKYTLKVDNAGTNDCYLTYSLVDTNERTVGTTTRLTTDPVVIDTVELACTDIYIEAVIKATKDVPIVPQTFKIQLNYGEYDLEGYKELTERTQPINTGYEGKTVVAYGRNLFDTNANSGFSTAKTNNNITISGKTFEKIGNTLDTKYFECTMNEDNYIQYTDGNTTRRFVTPLLKGDDFTFIFNVVNMKDSTTANINNVQVVYGHTNYEPYTEFTKYVLSSDANGNCDVSKIKSPYCFVALDTINNSDNKNYTLYLQYDRALSSDWVERQLDDLNAKIDSTYIVDNVFDGSSENAQSGKAINKILTKRIPVEFNSDDSYAIAGDDKPADGVYIANAVINGGNNTYMIDLEIGQIQLSASDIPSQLTSGARINIKFGDSIGGGTYLIDELEVISDKFIEEDFVEYKANMEFDTIDLSLVDIDSTSPSEAFEQFDGIYEILDVAVGATHTSFGQTTSMFYYTFSNNSSSLTVKSELEFTVDTKVRLKTKMTTDGICKLEEFTVIKDVKHKADKTYVQTQTANLNNSIQTINDSLSTLSTNIPNTYVRKDSLPKISPTEPENAKNGDIWIQPNSANGLIIDGIIEQGWAGDKGEWYYTKYRSGKIEAWYKSAVAFSVPATAVKSVDIKPPTGLFTDTPHFIHPQIRSTTESSGYGELTIYADNTGTTSSNIRVSFGNHYGSLLKPAINMYVVQFGSNSQTVETGEVEA